MFLKERNKHIMKFKQIMQDIAIGASAGFITGALTMGAIYKASTYKIKTKYDAKAVGTLHIDTVDREMYLSIPGDIDALADREYIVLKVQTADTKNLA